MLILLTFLAEQKALLTVHQIHPIECVKATLQDDLKKDKSKELYQGCFEAGNVEILQPVFLFHYNSLKKCFKKRVLIITKVIKILYFSPAKYNFHLLHFVSPNAP